MALDLSAQRARIAKPKSKETWSGVEVVDYFAKCFDVPKHGPWGYSAWLRRVKETQLTIHQAKQLVQIMEERAAWLATKGEKLQKGQWMFNRFRKEIKVMGVDKFISAKSPFGNSRMGGTSKQVSAHGDEYHGL